MNPLKVLGELGQSIWLDNMQRRLVTTGELKRLIENDGLKGLTSNPTIFQKAVEGSSDYDDFFAQWTGKGATPGEVFDALSIRDIRDAAAIFRPVWEATGHRDGYCSLEVAPPFAHDTEGTVAEARRLWKALASPNVMIKIPGTVEGVPAIEQAIFEGININVTLLFGQDAYVAVAEAFIRGLERRAGPPGAPHPPRPGEVHRARETGGSPRRAAGLLRRCGRPGGHRQRQAGLPPLPGDLRQPPVEGSGRQGSEDPARPLGQHQHQESGLAGRVLRRGADRSGHGGHRPRGDAGRLPRPRKAEAHPRSRAGPRRRGDAEAGAVGHLDEGGDRPAGGRGREELRRQLPRAARRGGGQAGRRRGE